jgi:hypothetical protein
VALSQSPSAMQLINKLKDKVMQLGCRIVTFVMNLIKKFDWATDIRICDQTQKKNHHHFDCAFCRQLRLRQVDA